MVWHAITQSYKQWKSSSSEKGKSGRKENLLDGGV